MPSLQLLFKLNINKDSIMKRLLLFLGLAFMIASCTKDDKKDKLSVPSTYEFTRDGKTTVGVSGQWKRLDMHSAIKAYAGSATSQEVSAAKLLALISNTNNPFTTNGAFFTATELNESGKQIWNKTSVSDANKGMQSKVQAYFTNLFSEQERISKLRGNTAANGIAGIAGKRLVDEKGFEIIQVLSKSIMGACELDQLNNYLADGKMRVENDKVEEGKNYTKMEHHFDEAFGYTGLPLNPSTDYSDKTSDAGKKHRRFWAGYLNSIAGSTAGKDVKTQLYDAFLKGRTAIVNKDYTERDAQRQKIRELMAKACAIRAVHYFAAGAKALKATPGDGEAFHEIGEGIGFVYSLQFVSPEISQHAKSVAAASRLSEVWNKGLYANDSADLLLDIAGDIADAYGFKIDDAL